MTTPVVTVLTEIGGLKTRLLALPAGYAETRRAYAETAKRVEAIRTEIKDVEAEELLLASLAIVKDVTKGEEKPRYSNEAARKAAVARALAQNSTHQDRLKRLAIAETEALNAELRLKQIEDEQRVLRAVVDLTVSEVALITGR